MTVLVELAKILAALAVVGLGLTSVIGAYYALGVFSVWVGLMPSMGPNPPYALIGAAASLFLFILLLLTGAVYEGMFGTP